VVGVIVAACAAAVVAVSAGDQKFYDDDPILREPETQDASKVQAWKNVLSYDLIHNLFASPADKQPIRAQDINTIDELPDSGWFTNRILAREVSLEEAVRGPVTGPGPAAGPMTVTRAKPEGVSPGFVLQDSAGVTWFVQFDAAKYPEAATGAAIVANRIFHLLGYWQAEYHLAELRPETLSIGPKATPRRRRARSGRSIAPTSTSCSGGLRGNRTARIGCWPAVRLPAGFSVVSVIRVRGPMIRTT
jgi:hypothetical protein